MQLETRAIADESVDPAYASSLKVGPLALTSMQPHGVLEQTGKLT